MGCFGTFPNIKCLAMAIIMMRIDKCLINEVNIEQDPFLDPRPPLQKGILKSKKGKNNGISLC